MFYNRFRLAGGKYCLLIGLVIPFMSCQFGTEEHKPPKDSTQTIEKTVPPEKSSYNIYIETSGSMNGYLKANPSDFIAVVTGLVTDIKHFSSDGLIDSLRLNYLGNGSLTETNVIKDFNDKLNPTSFKELSIKDSDFDRFFDTILSHVSHNNVAILISDMTFSPADPDQKKNIYNYLNNQQRALQDKFSSKLDSLPVATLLIRFQSQFTGNYFDYLENPHPINGERPYFVTVVASPGNMAHFLKEIRYKHKDAYLFDEPHTSDVKAKVVMKKSVMQGDYNFEKPASKLSIVEAQPDKNGNFQFCIAADLSDAITHAGEAFVADTSHYQLSPQSKNYSVAGVERTNEYEGFTHLIKIRTTDLHPSQTVTISLRSDLPDWIKTASIDDDRDIEKDEKKEKTFGFNYLINGIAKAYSNKYHDKPHFSLSINVSKN